MSGILLKNYPIKEFYLRELEFASSLESGLQKFPEQRLMLYSDRFTDEVGMYEEGTSIEERKKINHRFQENIFHSYSLLPTNSMKFDQNKIKFFPAKSAICFIPF